MYPNGLDKKLMVEKI